MVNRFRDPVALGGFVIRGYAHEEGIPHATVLIAPVRIKYNEIQLLVFRRPRQKQTCPDTWDIFGGHVELSSPFTDAVSVPGPLSVQRLKKLFDQTALREAREEILVENMEWQLEHFDRYGDFGEFTHGIDDPEAKNVECSTLYITTALQDKTNFEIRESSDEGRDDFRNLPNRFASVDKLIDEFKQESGQFADGIARLLRRLEKSDCREHFDSFVRNRLSGQ